MAHYKLIYFNVMSRAELIRFIFAAANAEYEEVRVELDFTKWPAMKDQFPYKKLPVLEVDGVVLSQSVAIAHYLASQFGLCGQTALQGAQSLAIVEQTKDLIDAAVTIYWREPDANRKKEKKAEFEILLKNTLEVLEATAAASKSGYFVGDSLTWADLAFNSCFEIIPGYLECTNDLLASYPALKAHRDKINGLETIKNYKAKRPQTKF